MVKDVTMDAKDAKEVVEAPKVEAEVKVLPFGFHSVQKTVSRLEKAIGTHNALAVQRAFRHNTEVRRNVTRGQLTKTIEWYVPEGSAGRESMLKYAGMLPEDPVAEEPEADAVMEGEDKGEDAAEAEKKVAKKDKPRTAITPELQVYVHTLVVSSLVREKLTQDAAACVTNLLEYATEFNVRTVDPFVARAWQYYSDCYEALGQIESIRSHLLAAHRTACLRHDEIGQATLLNLLLRNLLHFNLYDQAFKLISKTVFPEAVSNCQLLRYLYYFGKIQAVQLDYSDAYQKLMQCTRKQTDQIGLGFRTIVHKLVIIVQLLMGEVPERKVFDEKADMRGPLLPYFKLTKAVRVGDLLEFNEVLKQYSDLFNKDKTYTLILRLRHNVIKTGLRKINMSYSCISFEDISNKLHLGSAEDAEFICAKAIRDGVIDAQIDHEKKWMTSKEMSNIYITTEPQQAFHKRISFCMDTHNQAVKNMQYPPDAYKKDLESAEERANRESEEQEELAEALKDEMEEED
jgi:26S proteasome regulatory subunit N3